MATELFIELSVVIASAILIIALMRVFKQPIIIGYIITGILFAIVLAIHVPETGVIDMFSQLGIAILLFMVGLNLNPKIIKDVGKASLITGIGQVVFTSLGGYLIARLLGFTNITSLYVAIALTFSSTIIIMKLLSDKNDLDKLYGKISVGFLIVQDFIAIIILLVISSLSSGESLTYFLSNTLITGILVTVGLFLVSIYALPKMMKPIARSQEYLLLFSLGWCIVIATIYELSNFSLEIGALLAGISLSLSPYRFEISSKLRPIRDFFIFMFFIWLGSQMSFGSIESQIVPVIVFSAFILIGNPLIVMVLMGMMNYKKQTGFQAGLTVAQISEFSLILIALGVKVGHLAPEILSMVTFIGIITITGSTYMIIYSHALYRTLAPLLSIFERKKLNEDTTHKEKFDVILFGADRTGHDILKAFKDKKDSLLIVDYNPDKIEKLESKGYSCLYGDISDIDLLDELDLCGAKMIISTIQDIETNQVFLRRIKLCNPDSIVLVVANTVEESLQLYENGASYVITPHFIGGKYISDKIKDYGFNIKKFVKEQEDHIKHLNSIGEEL